MQFIHVARKYLYIFKKYVFIHIKKIYLFIFKKYIYLYFTRVSFERKMIPTCYCKSEGVWSSGEGSGRGMGVGVGWGGRIFRRRTVRRKKKMFVSVRLGKVRLG